MEQTNEQSAVKMKRTSDIWKMCACPRCGHVQLAFKPKQECDSFTTCQNCNHRVETCEWRICGHAEQSALGLPTDHDVISKPLEQAMVEALRKPKRVRMFKEDYVNECIQLRVENHALKCAKAQLIEFYETQKQDMETMADQIHEPSIRFAIGLIFKAIKQGRF